MDDSKRVQVALEDLRDAVGHAAPIVVAGVDVAPAQGIECARFEELDQVGAAAVRATAATR